MKLSLTLVSILALLSLKGMAQPVVNSDYWPTIGTSGSHQQEVILSGPLQTPPGGGLNQVWDYSSLTNPGEVNPFSIKDTTGAHFRSPFAASNFIHSHYMNGDWAMRYDGSGISEIGFGNGDTTANTQMYTRPRVLLPLGLHYQDTFADSILLYQYTSGVRSLARAVAYRGQYIGTGTLKVNDATDGSLDIYNDCILVHYRMRYYTPNGSGGFITETFDFYNWHNEDGAGVPLAQWLHHTGASSGDFYRFDRIGALRVPPAQPRITPAFLNIYPGLGNYHITSVPVQQTPQEGINQVWNYSNLTHSSTDYRLQVTTSGMPAAFADCNLAWHVFNINSPQTVTTTYYQNSPSGLREVGLIRQNPFYSVRYSDGGFYYLNVPMRFGKRTRDSVIMGQSVKVVETKFAGVGTLRIPSDTAGKPVVMMSVMTRTYHGVVPADPMEEYRFFSASQPLGSPIATMRRQGNNASFEYVTDFALVTAQQALDLPALTIAPNPAGSRILLPSLKQGGTGRILDMAGKTVQTVFLDPASPAADVSALRPGLYLLTLNTPQGPVTQRFVKE